MKEAKPKPRAYKLFDGNGLILAVYPTGKKVWRLDYYDLNRKRKTYTIGDAQYISLADARKKRDELKGNLKNDQSISKKDAITFGVVFYEWFEKWKLLVVPTTAKRALSAVEKDCFPVLQNLEISKIRPRDIVLALDPLDKRCSYETLKKVKSSLKLCFDYAIARGLCEMNPVMMVTREAFKRPQSSQHRSLDIREVYQIVDFIGTTNCTPSTKYCIEFILRNISRVQEAAQATWSEIDTEKWIWTIPAKRMKMRREHVIPLSCQSMLILKKQKEEYPDSKYIFASEGPNGHINKETPRIALNKAGIDTTIHGFRHLASTILNETLLFKPDVIEVALAHVGKDQIRATYNNAQYTEKRREMMQWWSDFIDMCDTERNNLKALKKFNII
ncbi:tyrosine-type recombinase/integrase [Wohlfahrtiimonas populi]|uniref:tyrosine-type recombinase/integrase n=1 Tax=Wohlfahrtiimonas populi TaxID=1940240 RepID=UPI0022B8C7F2|nr:tyrosine-type recombinase/integrase [Wohlfahrtiimonas populi]